MEAKYNTHSIIYDLEYSHSGSINFYDPDYNQTGTSMTEYDRLVFLWEGISGATFEDTSYKNHLVIRIAGGRIAPSHSVIYVNIKSSEVFYL